MRNGGIMNNNRKVESGQLWRDNILEEESWMFVVKVWSTSVEVRYLDSWGTDETNYIYDKKWFVERSVFIM